MCGICSESRLIEYVIGEYAYKKGSKELIRKVGSLDLNALLQETSYLTEALNESLPLLKAKYQMTHYANNVINSNTIVCRGIEILFTEGYNSDKYQKILSHECYRWAIKQNCAPDKRSRLHDLNLSGCLAALYKEETFLEDQRCNIFARSKELSRRSSHLLEFFIDWWFLGKNLKERNPIEYKGVYDTLNPRHEESLELFNLLFPSIFFSVLFLAGKKRNALIRKMLFNDPCYTPDFELMDMWLKRKAAEIIVRRFGMGEISPHFEKIDGRVYSQTGYSMLDYLSAKLEGYAGTPSDFWETES